MRTALQWVRTVYAKRQEERVDFVIRLAAQEAGLDPKELVDRLDTDMDRQGLFIRTLRAAQDAGVVEKLVGLARALAAGAVTEDPATVQWEVAFVRTLADLDRSHLRVLEVFTTMAQKLGIPLAPDYVSPVIKEDAIRQQAPDLAPVLDPLLATLQRHGVAVLNQTEVPTVPLGSSIAPLEDWRLTPFGHQFLLRMREVGATLADEGVMKDPHSEV